MMDKPSDCLRQMADILDRIDEEEKAKGCTELSMRLKMNYAQTADHFTNLMRKR
jgi:hypothetical protein